jgi:spermidine synthase
MHRIIYILIVSCCSGYISLSQEILWVRAMGWATEDSPKTFAYVLGFFLIGIAAGAYVGKKVSENDAKNSFWFLAGGIFINGIIFFTTLPVTAALYGIQNDLGTASAYALTMLSSFFSGWTFPLLCHAAVSKRDLISIQLSWVYAANIVGSTLGPIITGFILLDVMALDRCFMLMSAASAVLCCFTILVMFPDRRRWTILGTVAVASLLFYIVLHPLYGNSLKQMLFKKEAHEKPDFKFTVENRNGIIVVVPDVHDQVWGGGVYDGRFNLDPILRNDNWIDRAYVAPCFQEGKPIDALVIGLGSGSWTRVVANNSSVKNVTVVEINPGYEKVIRHYPDHATLFNDKKIKVIYDDGRRWLLRNPQMTFDLIVMNTSVHWRSHITNLLSRDFLLLCKHHMKPDSVMLYNITESMEAAYTASTVFRYVHKYRNSLVVSDSPLVLSPDKRWKCFLNYKKHYDSAMFAIGDSVTVNKLKELAALPTPDVSAIRFSPDIAMITDDSMVTEFKGWWKPKQSFGELFSRLVKQKNNLR